MDKPDRAVAEVSRTFLKVIRAIVEMPDGVVLTPRTNASETVFHLHVEDSDLSRIIGKQGEVVNALRVFLAGVSTKHSHRFVLKMK